MNAQSPQHFVAALNDKQVAHVVVRGTAVVLSFTQEETVDSENGVVYPAKSFTFSDTDSIKNLQKMLEKVFRDDGEST